MSSTESNLEFQVEPLSGQLVAHSEKCRYTSYWIDDGAWTYLTMATLTSKGPMTQSMGCFNNIEDAKSVAEDLESRLQRKN